MVAFEKDNGLKQIKGLVKDANLSRIYGFILYTDKDPFVIKVLKDQDYWKALDDISGCRWPIFSVRPLQQGKYHLRKSSGYTDFMMQVWDEPKQNFPILNDFGLDSSEDLPCFVAFMWDDNDELHKISIPIQGRSVVDCYNSIETIVKAIAKTEDMVTPENKQSVNVFRNVEIELKALNFRYKWGRRSKIVTRFVEFLAAFI